MKYHMTCLLGADMSPVRYSDLRGEQLPQLPFPDMSMLKYRSYTGICYIDCYMRRDFLCILLLWTWTESDYANHALKDSFTVNESLAIDVTKSND